MTTPATPASSRSYEYDAVATPIVDGTVLENHKENIAPSRDGRSAAALSQIFSTSRSQRSQELAAAHAQYKQLIAETNQADEEGSDDVDPLDPYVQYVRWTLDSYPSGKSTESGLLQLLEEATRRFKDDPRYKNDMRYFKLWMQYATYVERPSLIYAFMLANEIGTQHASVYEEYAIALERDGNRHKADQIWQLGIHRKPHRFQRLQQRYKEFLTRMVSAPAAPPPPDSDAPSSRAPPTLGGRSVLGTRATSARGDVFTDTSSRPNSNAGRIPVFTESTPDEGAQTNEWPQLDTRIAASKENRADAVPWKGEKLHQRGAHAPKTPKIEIFRDDTASNTSTSSGSQSPEHLFQSSRKGPSVDEALVKNPFRNYDGPVTTDFAVPSLPSEPHAKPPPRAPLSSQNRQPRQNPAAPAPSGPVMPPGPSEGKRREVLKVNIALLYPARDQEYCVQEARAKLLGYRDRPWPPPPPPAPAPQDLAVPLKADGAGKRPRAQAMMHDEPTVTMNTKAAVNDVFSFFNSPERKRRRGSGNGDDDSDDSDSDDGDDGEGDRTVVMNVMGSVHKTPASTLANMAARTFTPYVDQNQNQNAPGTLSKENQSGRHAGFGVPPTPTPAGSSAANRIPVFSIDENAYASASKSRSAAINVFTPLGEKQPMKSFHVAADPQPTPRALSSSWSGKNDNVFLAETIREEDERSSATETPASKPRARFAVMMDQEAESRPAPKTPAPLSARFSVAAGPPPSGQNQNAGANARVPPAPASATKSAFQPFVDQPPAPTPSSRSAFSAASVFSSPPAAHEEDSWKPMDEQRPTSEPPMPPGQEHVEEEYEEDLNDDEGRQLYNMPFGGRLGRLQTMTPITERTFECTTAGTIPRGGSVRRPFEVFREEAEEEDEERPDAQLATRPPNRLLDFETRQNAFPPPSSESSSSGSFNSSFDDRSEHGDEAPFHVGDGFTIQATSGGPGSMSDSFVVVDKTEAHNADIRPSPSTSSFNPPNPCNPFDDKILESLLQMLPTPPAFHDLRHTESNQLVVLQKFAKKQGKRGSLANASMLAAEGMIMVLDSNEFEVKDKIGEGGFGAVFVAEDLTLSRELMERDDLDDDEEINCLVAVKAVNPCNIWESTVLGRLHELIPPSIQRSIIFPRSLFAFRDESFLILDYCQQGTLLDCVNRAAHSGVAPASAGGGMEELLVIFFTVELLKMIEALHLQGFIHGDLKIDNILIRLEEVPGSASNWKSTYDPSGDGGWAHKGIRIIDFGRAIDTNLFPPGQTFIGDWPTDDRDCVELREARPWTYQTDYFGLAGIIYCMLFGKYIETSVAVSPTGERQYRLSSGFKRYWQVDVWSRLFDILLNPKLARADGSLPLCDELAAIRAELEDWLVENCDRGGKSLKGLLKKVEISTL